MGIPAGGEQEERPPPGAAELVLRKLELGTRRPGEDGEPVLVPARGQQGLDVLLPAAQRAAGCRGRNRIVMTASATMSTPSRKCSQSSARSSGTKFAPLPLSTAKP